MKVPHNLTWTIMRVDQRTPLLRNGAAMMRAMARGWEEISRYGAIAGKNERAPTTAIVPWSPPDVPKRHFKATCARMRQLSLFADG